MRFSKGMVIGDDASVVPAHSELMAPNEHSPKQNAFLIVEIKTQTLFKVSGAEFGKRLHRNYTPPRGQYL